MLTSRRRVARLILVLLVALAAAPLARADSGISLLGSLDLTPPPDPAGSAALTERLAPFAPLRLRDRHQAAHADETVGDIAALGNLAFVGSHAGAPASSCGRGVDIVDISNPTAPVRVGVAPPQPGLYYDDVKAVAIGGRTILAAGAQRCQPGAVGGLVLYDVTTPSAPAALGFLPVTRNGVHELDAIVTPAGRALVIVAVPFSEAESAAGAGGRVGDIQVVDISDPVRPVRIGEYGVLDDFGRAAVDRDRRGEFAESYGHSARFNADGSRAFVSYWDSGEIILDLTDPANPRRIGRAMPPPSEPGDIHSAVELAGGRILAVTDESFWPYGTALGVPGRGGVRTFAVSDHLFSFFAARYEARVLRGTTTFVGAGCRRAAIPAKPAGPGLHIAVAVEGGCEAARKGIAARRAGYGFTLVMPRAANAGRLPVWSVGDVIGTGADPYPRLMAIPFAAGVRAFGGRALRAIPVGARGTRVTLRRKFNGWGKVRLYDVTNPAAPVEVGSFATATSLRARQAAADLRAGVLRSAHNAEALGNRLYVSWYSEGIRAIDVANPAAPVEVASWSGTGRPAGAHPLLLWSVIPHNGLLLASDLNFGLYVLRDDTAPPSGP